LPNGHIAQPDCVVAVGQQRAGDDTYRVGEVDDPRVGCGMFADALGDVEYHRHRAQCLGESAGTGRLLADTIALQGQGFIHTAGSLATDPQLDQHHVRTCHPGVQIAGPGQPRWMGVLAQDPIGERTHQGQPVCGRIDQRQLLDRQHVA
jgi:hypothetical protein